MALVGASGGEAGDGPPVRAQTSSTVGPKGGTGCTDFKTPRCTRLGKEQPRGAAQGSNAEGRAPVGARRGALARWSAGAAGLPFAQTAAVQNTFSPNFLIDVQHVMNRKAVDLTTLYNFQKGHIVFFSTDFAATSCQL
jgi:hypothetical protein